MLNYAVDPKLLCQYVPPGTEMDSFGGKTYVSLVGFRFINTKMFGSFNIPFHSNFLEANLRFYVRREKDGEQRRGVVFISEIVPRQAIALTARLVYGENYSCVPMKSRVETKHESITSEYRWRIGGEWCVLVAEACGVPTYPDEGTLEQFITEHYWGYSSQGRGGSLEYRVAHVPWRVWRATRATFDGNCSALYGNDLATAICRPPDCAFIADGSPVQVRRGQNLR